MFLKNGKPVHLEPKFDSSFISLLFDANGKHESWETDQNAPKEVILTSSSIKDKGDEVEDYDISNNPESFECPCQKEEEQRRMLGPIGKLKGKFKTWFKIEKDDKLKKRDQKHEYQKSIF